MRRPEPSVVSSISVTAPSAPAPAATASASTAAAACAAAASIIAARLPVAPAAARTEVADLLADLGVEGILERHLLAIVDGTTIALRRRRAPLGGGGSATAVAAAVVVAAERLGRGERHLAVRIDVVDAHLDLVTERQHVFHPVDAPSATELRDVDETVAAREDVHERTELRDVDDPAVVGLTHVGGGRVEDELDLAFRLGHLAGVVRPDA